MNAAMTAGQRSPITIIAESTGGKRGFATAADCSGLAMRVLISALAIAPTARQSSRRITTEAMTPTQLNKEIRAGAFFYLVTSDERPSTIADVVIKAKTVTKDGQRRVKLLTQAGWTWATQVRRSGSFDLITLDGEGPMTRWMN